MTDNAVLAVVIGIGGICALTLMISLETTKWVALTHNYCQVQGASTTITHWEKCR